LPMDRLMARCLKKTGEPERPGWGTPPPDDRGGPPRPERKGKLRGERSSLPSGAHWRDPPLERRENPNSRREP
jgi:hypothetical protein